jgi:hypothetical protein
MPRISPAMMLAPTRSSQEPAALSAPVARALAWPTVDATLARRAMMPRTRPAMTLRP